ncbi:MAG: hypothetical protein CFE21_00125 [Bacteroidetes bacterium B1(2017)]|nr:MAG: hypothetical protein CFE21_00125 [Bacteroidetes bacterium B1(2017)]
MKKNITKQFGLILLVVFAMLASNTSVKAQTEDENEEDESGFFSDGLNSNRFESSFGDNSTQRSTYEYKRRSSDKKVEQDQNNQPVRDLDIEVQKENSNKSTVIGGGSGQAQNGPGVNQNNSPSAGSTNGITTTGPTPKIKNVDPNIPDNPGDPDAPIDGGVLVALGIGFGVWRRRK